MKEKALFASMFAGRAFFNLERKMLRIRIDWMRSMTGSCGISDGKILLSPGFRKMGSFQVFEAEYSSNGRLQRFAADFTQ